MKHCSYLIYLLLSVFILASCGSTQKVYLGSSKKKTSRHAQKRKKDRSATRKSNVRYVTASRKPSKRRVAKNSAEISTRKKIVSEAKKFLGVPYSYGGKSAREGFDCSGFTSYVYSRSGLNVSGPSYTQAKKGRLKQWADLSIGDLVVFGKNRKVSHVAIVADVGNDYLKVIHSTSSRGVVIDEISKSKYWKKRYMYARDIVSN